MKTKLKYLALAWLLSIINYGLSTAHAQGTAFTYQGRLNLTASNTPATGNYDFRFKLFADALGNVPVGTPYRPA
jgi:hypothetical protein